MRWGTALAAVLVLLAPAWCDEGHQHTLTEAEIGSVHFPTSCSAALSSDFNRAVALLHLALEGCGYVCFPDKSRWARKNYFNKYAPAIDAVAVDIPVVLCAAGLDRHQESFRPQSRSGGRVLLQEPLSRLSCQTGSSSDSPRKVAR